VARPRRCTASTYAAETAAWFTTCAERGDSLDIEFRFTERIAAGDLASERGVFRITATRAGAGDLVFHSRFHTFARKAGGRWRIVADYDTNEDGAITPGMFAAAAAVEDTAGF
jgi:ketosteroid isomerase-like protein